MNMINLDKSGSLAAAKYQFGYGISKMVGPKKQAFCPRINMPKGNSDTYQSQILGNTL